MDKKSTYNHYWQFFLEIPIDLGNVAISVLIAYYFLVQDVTYIILAVLIELLAMIISISLRNTAVTMLDEDKINKRNVFFRISGEFFLVLIPALVSFFLILK